MLRSKGEHLKKFIVAISMIVLCQHTYAGVNDVSETIQDAWNFSATNPKSFITSDYTIETHQTYKFQYVNISAATKIYRHGATFCRMQLQHNGAKWKVFIAPESCKTICRTGYYGDKCGYTSPSTNSCDSDDLTNVFNSSTSPAPYQEKDIDVFYSNEKDVILLQVVSAGKHSIEVQPIEFYGNNDNNNNIGSVNTRGESFKLCANGYTKDSQTGECKCNSEPEEPEYNIKIYKSQMRKNQDGEECWMQIEPNEYKNCVLGSIPQNNPNNGGGNSGGNGGASVGGSGGGSGSMSGGTYNNGHTGNGQGSGRP